jgi:ribose transport system ATP-binding protein
MRGPRVLLLDEPTSALSGRDVDWLGDVIARAKADGITVLFISHRLPEMRAFCDTLTILRNGRHVRSGRVEEFTDEEVIELIIGRSLETAFPPRTDTEAAERPAPVLSVRDLSAGAKLSGVTLDLHPGEVVGIAGLQGMGQNDLFMALFGAEPLTGGQVLVDGAPVTLTSPADALDPSVAIGLVPEERKTQGLFLKMSGLENVALPVIARFRKGLLLDSAAERRAAAAAFAAVEVDERAHYLAASSFSGGNQQKISIAKWFVAQSRILLLLDPTRGIDVGTKHQLYELIRDFAAAGGAVLLYSTEVPELVHLSDRVGVIYEGRLQTWLEGAEITEAGVIDAALGGVSRKLSEALHAGVVA